MTLPSFESAFARRNKNAESKSSQHHNAFLFQDEDFGAKSGSDDVHVELLPRIPLPPVSSDADSDSSSSNVSSLSSLPPSTSATNIAYPTWKPNRKKTTNVKVLLPCGLCEKAFPSPSQLEEHFIFRHSDNRPHQCEHCPKVFKSKSNLKQHLRTHFGATFRCNECNKSFTESGYRYHRLTSHVANAEAAKRFRCQLCPKSFVQNKLLVKHVASCHSTERKYACIRCPATFKRKDHLSRHVADTHAALACEFCTETFHSGRKLRQHRKKVHGASTSMTLTTINAPLENPAADLAHFADGIDDSALAAFLDAMLDKDATSKDVFVPISRPSQVAF